MARMKRFGAYRRLDRPYTRRSKYRKKDFIRFNPNKLIVKYNMGNPQKEFEYELTLNTREPMQIRQNALESARMVCNRYLEKTLGKNAYYLELRAYPHHILRENPLAAGAGADRLSTGMSHAFGKPIGVAARFKKNQPVFMLKVGKQHVTVARESLRRAASKMPTNFLVVVTEVKIAKIAKAQ